MFKPTLLHSALLALTLSPMAALAEGPDFYINAPYKIFDDKLNLDNALGVSVTGGYRFNNPLEVEFNYAQTSTNIQGSNTDVDYTSYGISGLYHFAETNHLSPYVLLGIGNNKVDGNTTFDDDAVDAGLGVKYHATETFDVRAEVRNSYFMNDDFNDVSIGLGVGMRLGAAKPAPKPVAAPAPAPQLPKDSDNDGVVDSLDKCPDTAAKLKVDQDGCPILLKETVSISLNILFDTSSDVIKPEFAGEVKKVAEFLEQYQGTQVVIEGHTDTRGSNKLNKALSQKRADAVAKALNAQFGINASRIQAVGYGEERPLVATDTNPADQAKNRRVIAKVSAEKQTQALK